MTVHVAPHGRLELPRFHPEKHPAIQGLFGTHRWLAGLVGLALVGSVAIVGVSAVTAPRAVVTPPPTRAMVLSEVPLAKVFDATERQAIAEARTQAAALAAARNDDRTLDRQLRGQATVTVDPIALAASKADERSLDRQLQALKSSAGTVTALPTTFAGKPLPL